MLAIWCRECAFLGHYINRSSGNEVTVHTDNRAIDQLVVGKVLFLSGELSQFSPQGFDR